MKFLRFFFPPLMVMLLASALPMALAQSGGQQGGGNAGGGTGGKQPSSPPVITPPPRQQTPTIPQRMPQQIFFSGTVIQEDGSPPPFGTVIELECRGTTTRQTMAGSNGRFSFLVADSNRLGSLMPDASEGYNDSVFGDESVSRSRFQSFGSTPSQPTTDYARLMGCELRAQLAGYRSTAFRIDAAPQQGQNDVGTILIYRIERIQGTTVSATNLLAPKNAKKSLEKAEKALRKDKLEEAETLLKSALDVYPKYGEAWVGLGLIYQRKNQNDSARAAYLKAIELDRLFVKPYIRLSWLVSMEQKWQEAAEFTDRVLDLDPVTYPDVYYLSALANYNLNHLDLAEKRARQELRLDPKHTFPQVFMILANVFAMKNNTDESMQEMRNYLKYAPKAADAEIVRSRLETMQKVATIGQNSQPNLQTQKP